MITNYGELKTAIMSYLHRSDSETTNQIPMFVRSCEDMLNEQLRCSEMIKRSKTTPSGEYITLPADFITMQSIRLGDDKVVLLRTPQQQLPFDNTVVHTYSIFDNQIRIKPEPEDDIEIIYFAEVDPLTADSDTNDVLDAYPLLYLYGCMIEASLFVQDDARIPIWLEAFSRKMLTVNERYASAKYSGEAMQITFGV